MSKKRGSSSTSNNKLELEEIELRRGPWTLEEDALLMHYITCHGEGRWNLLARCSGLKRTGKSCRLRWLNYLKPDIKRGNLSPEEQLLILELHSKWGNRWSRIAQQLPGRTDNEIKNYWRTRVQKQARQLKIDANSSMFRDVIMRCYWIPRLMRLGNNNITTANAANHNYNSLMQFNHHDHANNPTNYHYPSADDQYYNSPNYNTMQDQIDYYSSSLTSSTAVHQVTNDHYYPYNDDLNCITFNQISSCSFYDTEKKNYSIVNNSSIVQSGLSQCYSMSADCTTSASDDSNYCMMNSTDENLWNMNDLYGILES